MKNGFLEMIYFFVVLRQNKVKGLPSSQSPCLNPKLIYAMKLQLKINFKMERKHTYENSNKKTFHLNIHNQFLCLRSYQIYVMISCRC